MLKLMLNISAAFDTLDVEIQIKNLAIYGFTETTSNWYQSFLTGPFLNSQDWQPPVKNCKP